MGWCTGSEVGDTIWDMVRTRIPKKHREKLAEQIYNYLCGMDADCWESDSMLIQDGKIAEKEKWFQ